MLIGDSLGVGMETKFRSLAKTNDYNPVTHVVSGTSIFQWVTWIKKDLVVHKPDLVVISLGTNDAVIFDRVKKFPTIYTEFVSQIEETGAVVVWIGPPNISSKRIPKITEARNFIKESVVNFYESEKFETPQGGDGVHSSASGYNKWMEGVWSWMEKQKIITKLDN